MKSWFQVVRPHDDIRLGQLEEAVFAADLAEVAKGRGAEVYLNEDMFFAKTYFTAGLRNLAKQVIRGLNGDPTAGNRIISLQTGFGGGKTHSLISLYHLAILGQAANERQDLGDLIKETGPVTFDVANRAVFTNTTNDVVQGRQEGNYRIRTIWGEIAYQLGGDKAYELVRPNDEQLTAPGEPFVEVLRQSSPGLILVDELADYCVKASAVRVGESTLADQTISFVQSLTEAVAKVPGIVLVATLPASITEVAASEQGNAILTALTQRLARIGKDTKPVDGDEVYEVIRRRLFEDVGDEAHRKDAASEYLKYYQTKLKSEVPKDTRKADYAKLIEKSYPFHPGLIEVFRDRWGSNHNFQRTRGVLQLLATIVGDLWKRKDNLVGGALIHTSDVNFSNLDALSTKLTALYGNGYDSVLTADVSGNRSNSYKIDDDKKEYGEYNLTKGITATILLASFGSDGANRGLTIGEIKQHMLYPNGANHNQVNAVIGELEGKAHYLHYSGQGGATRRYWFETKPNINILVNDAKSQVKDDDINAEVVRRLEVAARPISKINFIVDPPDDIPDQKKFSVLVLSPHYCSDPRRFNGHTKPKILKIASKKGNNDRILKNTLLFLVCSEVGYNKLKEQVLAYLAVSKIREDTSGLEAEQQKDIARRLSEADGEANTALVSAYSIVVRVRRNEAEVKNIVSFASTMREQLERKLPEFLGQEEWLLNKVGYRIMEKGNLMPKPGKPMQVRKIYDSFLQYDSYPMITGPQAIHESLLTYFEKGQYAIADGTPPEFNNYYSPGELPTSFDVLDEDFYLIDKADLPAPPVALEATPEVPLAPDTGINPLDAESPSSSAITDTEGPKELDRIVISGRVSLERYTDIFRYLIRPLVENDVKIDFTITGRSNAESPLLDNDPKVVGLRETAKQLGLNFDEE